MTANAANPAGGIAQAPGAPALTGEEMLQKIATECDASVSPTNSKNKKKSCMALGTDKHNCCEEKIRDHQKTGKPPELEGEKGYKRPALHDDGSPVLPAQVPTPVGGPRPSLSAAFAAGGSAVGQAFNAIRGNCYPDAAIINSDGSKTFADFKFPCPKGHPSGKGTSTGTSTPVMSPKQQGSYDALGYGTGNGTALTIYP
ncbi:MAG: hypothetical protein AAGA54_36055 [Myxococcota bacterium]